MKTADEKFEALMTAFALAHRKDKGTLKHGERISKARQRLRDFHKAQVANALKWIEARHDR